MKILKQIKFFALLLLIVACNDARIETEETAVIVDENLPDVEEAMEKWDAAWTGNNPQQLINLTSDDAILVLNSTPVPNDSIHGFLETGGSTIRNLQMETLQKDSNKNLAYQIGTYSHTYENDTVVHQGVYTFIWERSEDTKEWEVSVMNIGDVHPEPEMEEELP